MLTKLVQSRHTFLTKVIMYLS